MGLTSLQQVCMDSSDWLQQGTIISEENPSPMTPPCDDQEDILACSRPLMDQRRLIRPQHEQALKCPRCESTHTKFCYYNNYSLSQPRYFCKTCRRYWTKGGTLRNIPVGGGCRKNKKVSSTSNPKIKPSSNNTTVDLHYSPPADIHVSGGGGGGHQTYSNGLNYNLNSSTQLQLAFPHDQIHLSSSQLLPNGLFGSNTNPPGFWMENHAQMDFMENKYETLFGTRSDDLMMGGVNSNFFHGICSETLIPSADDDRQNGINGTILESYHHQNLEMDMKPNYTSSSSKNVASLEWHHDINHRHHHHHHQQAAACNSDAGIINYLGGIGSWTGLMNAYGSSNPLV